MAKTKRKIETPPTLSEQEYLAQLEKLYPNCPFPRALFTISAYGHTMGDIASGVKKKGCETIPFQIVDLLNGRLPLTENKKPTPLLKAFAAFLGRPVQELLSESQKERPNNYFEPTSPAIHPNGDRFQEGSQTGMVGIIKSYLTEVNFDGSSTADEISAKVSGAKWRIARNQVYYREARGPARTRVRPAPNDRLLNSLKN